MLSTGEDAEQLKFLFTAGRDANGTFFWKTSLEVF